ncbi:MAG: class I SAM-dependent methyltransferase [Gemmatimonadaceae bacterium]
MTATTTPPDAEALKQRVRKFWDSESCGEVYATGETAREQYEAQRATRYALEPYIAGFARFEDGTARDVLEIGVGMGADHIEWARSKPRSLTGIDLTTRAIEHTRRRLREFGHDSRLRVGDAENLPFTDDAFDIVYSWGVLHHSPDTGRAIREVYRVLRPGGIARLMIYHTHSIVGDLLWIRYALLAGHPARSLTEIYARHLESPGTKAFNRDEALAMCSAFTLVSATSRLSFGDLLQGAVGQRHRSAMLAAAKRLWPRWLIQRVLRTHGLLLLIEAVK